MAISRKKLFVGLLFGSIVGLGALAAEYFLWNVNMTYDQDHASEFSSTQNFFKTAQTVLNKDGKWRAGDLFTVKYSDGTVANFELSTRGMACSLGHCKWASTMPLNDPPTEVIRSPEKAASIGVPVIPGIQSIAVTSSHTYDLYALSSIVVRVENINYARRGTVFVGPMNSGSDGGRCNPCPPKRQE